jgi:hypothetical protein
MVMATSRDLARFQAASALISRQPCGLGVVYDAVCAAGATDADQASNGAKPLWKGTAMELPGGAAHGYAAKMPMRESTALVQAWPVREKSSPWISLRQ